jgi:hypothetical protein
MRRTVVIPRQIAMYLAKQLTDASLPEIGSHFGDKHHTTVMHAIAKIEEQRCADTALDTVISKLLKILKTLAAPATLRATEDRVLARQASLLDTIETNQCLEILCNQLQSEPAR